jgi:hypothetical protein
MPKQQLAFEKDGPKRLELSWGGFWKDFTARVDGAEVLSAHGQGELKAGRSATLPDGSVLAIRLETGFGNTGLVITRNGQPLPGTSSDPETQVKLAGGIVYFLAGFNVLLSIIGFAFDVPFLKENLGYGGLIMGAIFGVLGFFTMKRSFAALIVAISLYALDGVLSLGFAFAASAPGRTPNFGGIFMHVILIMAMIRGAKAMKALKENAA